MIFLWMTFSRTKLSGRYSHGRDAQRRDFRSGITPFLWSSLTMDDLMQRAAGPCKRTPPKEFCKRILQEAWSCTTLVIMHLWAITSYQYFKFNKVFRTVRCSPGRFVKSSGSNCCPDCYSNYSELFTQWISLNSIQSCSMFELFREPTNAHKR